MKFLVTGGAGFIGGHTAARLLEEGNDVVIVDCITHNYDSQIKYNTLEALKIVKPGKLWIYIVSVNDTEPMRKIFGTHKFDCILHFAASPGVRFSVENPTVNFEKDVPAMLQLLQFACEFNISHFTFASSSAVYGMDSEPPFSEEQKCDKPVSPYAASKRACEQLAFTYHHLYGLNVSCLRFFTVYGPRGRPDMAAFKFIDAICKGTPIHLYGNGSNFRAFTYISDIVDGIVASIKTSSGYRIINLGGDTTYTVNKLISVIERRMKKKARVIVVDSQPGDVPLTSADQTIAIKLLGYYPKVALEEGISAMVEWYLNYVAGGQTQNGSSGAKHKMLSMEETLPV